MSTRTSGCRRRLVGLGPTAVCRSFASTLVVSCLAMVAGPAVAGPPPPPTCDEAPYDADGNSAIEPLADGLLMLRYFFGFRGSVLINGAVGQGCTRCTAPEIEDFIADGLAGCPECGDNVAESGEDCDGPDLGGATCGSEGFEGGTLGCTPECVFDVSACDNCGDSVVDFGEGEVCDGDNLGGASCISLGLSGGELGCSDACIYDTTNCIP